MPEFTPYPFPELREVDKGNNNGILMETVFQMLVTAVVLLNERVTELEKQNVWSP